MRKLTHLLAAAAIAGLAAMTSASSASPIGAGLSDLNAVPSVASGDLVQKVHGWHCRKRYGWYRGHKYRHRHRRACYDDDYYYDDYHYDYYGAYPFYGVPFFSFQFFDDDDHHFRRHRHFRRHKHRRHHRKKWKHYY